MLYIRMIGWFLMIFANNTSEKKNLRKFDQVASAKRERKFFMDWDKRDEIYLKHTSVLASVASEKKILRLFEKFDFPYSVLKTSK